MCKNEKKRKKKIVHVLLQITTDLAKDLHVATVQSVKRCVCSWAIIVFIFAYNCAQAIPFANHAFDPHVNEHIFWGNDFITWCQMRLLFNDISLIVWNRNCLLKTKKSTQNLSFYLRSFEIANGQQIAVSFLFFVVNKNVLQISQQFHKNNKNLRNKIGKTL